MFFISDREKCFSSASTQFDSGENTGYFSEDKEGSVPGIKRPRTDNQRSFPSGIWVKNAWSYNSDLPYAAMFCTGATLSGTSWSV
jgi:hypothetical protein